MNSIQLSNYFPEKEFLGVFAADKIPSKIKFPVSLIANTAPEASPGEHWVAIYISKAKEGYYFDSFGRPWWTVPSIGLFLKKKCKIIRFNTKQIQHLKSTKCGEFSAVFLKFMIAGRNSENYLKLFNTNLMLNEKIIHSYFLYFLQ